MTASHSFADLLVKEKPEVITPLDLGESSLDHEISADAPHPLFDEEPNKEAGIPALTPIMDTIDGWSSIDWTRVRDQLRAGVNNVGIALAVVSEKTHELGVWLAKV